LAGLGGFFTRNGKKNREKVRETGHTGPIFGSKGMLNEIPTQSGQGSKVWSGL
jgi:hypothetical protein